MINAFRDEVTDIKTMEEIVMKKPKTVADLLAVADECIEASEARARLLDPRGKGPAKKKPQEDREVNATNRGGQKCSDPKEKRPSDAKKWCDIHRTIGHDLEECRTYLDRKKKGDDLAPAEPRRGDHRQADDEEEEYGSINMIFGGSLSITSKTQTKKLEREIHLDQKIEPGQKMKWSDTDIRFGPEDHPVTELSNRNLSFVVKLPIGKHKVAKTLIDTGASLNLIMRKTFIEMGIPLSSLVPVHDTFHGVIPG